MESSALSWQRRSFIVTRSHDKKMRYALLQACTSLACDQLSNSPQQPTRVCPLCLTCGWR